MSGHHDATPTGTRPTWATALAPTGFESPTFGHEQNFTTAWTPVLSGDWTMATFANAAADGFQDCVGWNRAGVPNTGIGIGRGTLSSPAGQKFGLYIGNGTVTTVVPSDNVNVAGTWYWLVATRVSGTISFYVNAVKQSTTSTSIPSFVANTPIRMGYNIGESDAQPNVNQSCVAVWTSRGLSQSEISTIYAGL